MGKPTKVTASPQPLAQVASLAPHPIWAFLGYILTEYRGWFVFVFLLPVSVVVNLVWWMRTRVMEYRNRASLHEKRVAAVALAVRQAAQGKPLCTNRSGWATMSLKLAQHKSQMQPIPTHDLVDILSLDEEAMTVRVEPLVTMGQMTRYLVPKGWTLPVLPELDDLTVGGLLMGFGIESSSHIHGLFQETCIEYEIVLGDGRVVKARADNDFSDLFCALPWSYGTLGFVTSCTLKIVRCQPWVKLVYRRCHSVDELTAQFAKSSSRTDVDFVESLAYSLHSGVVMEGTFTAERNDVYELRDDEDSPAAFCGPSGKRVIAARFNNIGLWFKKWFYVHADEFSASLLPGEVASEVVPLRDYYHRHTKGIFWEMKHIMPFADQAWFRYAFGWAVPPNIGLLKLTQTSTTRRLWKEQFVVQDMLVPVSSLKESLVFMDKRLGVYPIWLCPHLVVRHSAGGMLQVSPGCKEDKEMYVDIGLYGVPEVQPYNHRVEMPALEEFVRRHHGYQGLYAISYMSKPEFRVMFHHELYDQCREKYHGSSRFADVYEKTCGTKFVTA